MSYGLDPEIYEEEYEFRKKVVPVSFGDDSPREINLPCGKMCLDDDMICVDCPDYAKCWKDAAEM